MLDENTDVSVMKFLGVTVRYFSVKLQGIESTYLRLIEIEAATMISTANPLETC